jgi:hypothetical protein
MNTNPVSLTYKMNHLTFNKNLDGISQEESLIEIPNVNSINWIAGHILVSRNNLFRQIGLKDFVGNNVHEIYDRGTKLSDNNTALDLDKIKNLFDESQISILNELQNLNDLKKLDELAFFSFHESYHIGQLGIIRKLIGKPGAIQ